MLNFYGFCCPGNKFDSIKLLLTKVLKKDQKMNLNAIIQAMVLTNGSIEKRNQFLFENRNSKIVDYLNSQVSEVKLKLNRLSFQLMFNLRVHCAWFYKNEDITTDNASEFFYVPTDLEFEFVVLQVYKQVLAFIDKGNPGRFNA